MNQERIGKFIKEIRLKENLSQQKFAEKYGVTYQAVSKWENGKNMPDIAILKKMCQEYNTNLNDFLETKKTNKNKKRFIFVILLLLFLGIILYFFFHDKNNKNFEFKTISATCDNFDLFGSIAYNDNKSSIYISNITYCGEEDDSEYIKIECTLYETEKNTKTEISQYNHETKEEMTLKEFLKDVNFVIDNYDKACKNYKENSLNLEIHATKKDKQITTYKIPLELQNSCN